MKKIHRASSRALITAATAGAAMSIALVSGAGPASAHVHVDAEPGAAPGGTAVLTFRVPGESEKGALTTEFSVALPNVASARTEVMPGWTARLDRDVAAGTVRSVTWTAAPSVGISSDQFALFDVSVTLPNQPSVTLPATQTYSDGTVVRWDQPPLPGGGEPEHPAPMLTLTGTGGGDPDDHQPPQPQVSAAPASPEQGAAAPDDTARWLAGGALILAAVAVVASLVGAPSHVTRRFATAMFVSAVLAVLALTGAGTASAHAIRLSADPAPDSSVGVGPARASATFNEQLQTNFAAMTLVGPDGNLWSTGEAQINGAVASVELRPLGPTGTYTVNYRVTSADGHVVSGAWSFELTVAGTGSPGPPVAPVADGGIPTWPFVVLAVLIVGAGALWAVRRRA